MDSSSADSLSSSTHRSKSTITITPFRKKIDNQSINSMISIDTPETGKRILIRDTVVTLIIITLGQTISLLSVSIYQVFFNVIISQSKHKIGCIYAGIFYIIFGFIWMCINKFQISTPPNYFFILFLFESQSIFLRTIAIQTIKIPLEYIFIFGFFSPFIVYILKRFYLKEKKFKNVHYILLFVELISVILFYMGSYRGNTNFSIYDTEGGFFVLLGSIILECLFYVKLENNFRSNNDIFKYFSFSMFIGIILISEGLIFQEYNNFSMKEVANWINCFYIVIVLLMKFVLNSVTPFFIKFNNSVLFTLSLSSNGIYLFFVKMIFMDKKYSNGIYFYVGLIGMNISLFLFGKYKLLKHRTFHENQVLDIKKNLPDEMLYPDKITKYNLNDDENDNVSKNSYFNNTDDMGDNNKRK